MLNRRASDRDVADLHEIGRVTLERLQARHPLLTWFQSRRRALESVESATQRLVGLLQLINPERWTEEQFVEVDQQLGEIINELERHFTNNVSQTDTAHCHIMGAAIQSIKDARGWLVQGLSPNPKMRPTDSERRARADAHASSAWAELIS